MPRTPVKVKTSHNLVGDGDRPWQSVVAAKVRYGLGFGLDIEAGVKEVRYEVRTWETWRSWWGRDV